MTGRFRLTAFLFRRAVVAGMALNLIFGGAVLFAQAGAPAAAVDKVAAIPDFWQADPRGKFANGGRDYCCPVAVSNSLMYLSGQGYGSLAPEAGGSPFERQAALIRLLASPSYFDTDPVEGTGPTGILRGVRRYVEERGYACRRLEYEGWRKVGAAQRSAVVAPLPELDWLKRGIDDPHGAVWLNIGWYTPGAAPGKWKRGGGHWLTLVGYGGSADPRLLLVHNSLISRSGTPDAAAQAIRLEPLPDERIVFDDGTSRSTRGMYRISGPGLPVKAGHAAFLDTAIVLVVGNRS